jgi:predicted metal-dependent HD superfamily phosphohydrolase
VVLDALPEAAQSRLVDRRKLGYHLTRWYAPTARRRYHTLTHVRRSLFCLIAAPRHCDQAHLAVAILFHDAVYHPGAPNNEEQSCGLAREYVPVHFPGLSVERIERYIMTTKDGAMPATDDERRMVDIDYSILGVSRSAYTDYARAVRAEYEPVVGVEGYRRGRSRWLTQAQERAEAHTLFHLQEYRDGFEDQARENLAWEQQWLQRDDDREEDREDDD